MINSIKTLQLKPMRSHCRHIPLWRFCNAVNQCFLGLFLLWADAVISAKRMGLCVEWHFAQRQKQDTNQDSSVWRLYMHFPSTKPWNYRMADLRFTPGWGGSEQQNKASHFENLWLKTPVPYRGINCRPWVANTVLLHRSGKPKCYLSIW